MNNCDPVAILDTPHTQITMRDGCRLSARTWMPDHATITPAPTILEMLPYRKRDGTEARDETTHGIFARHGYVCLRVDLRETGESEGLFDDEYSEQELCDIEDTITWIANQPWSDGNVGIMGISWGGFNGLQVAARSPAALKAVISQSASVDRFADDIHYKGGCQLTENVNWACSVMSWFSLPPDPHISGDNWRNVWLDRLENTPFLARNWMGHQYRDAYWRHASVCEDFSAIKTPVLIIGGWHDGYRNTPARLLSGKTQGIVKAIMGPWNHKYPHCATPGPRIDFISEALRWWDHWLKGQETGVERDPDCRTYIMNSAPPARSYAYRAGEWYALQHWPSPDSIGEELTLRQGTLAQSQLNTPVVIQPNADCGTNAGKYFPYGFGAIELPDDQTDDNLRALCFDGITRDEEHTLLGAPILRLKISSDQTYGQIIARLCDIAPDGRATLITQGMLDLRFRDGFETPTPLLPNTAYAVTIPLDQTAYSLPADHKLQLALSSSYWPFIWPAPGNTVLTIHNGTLQLPTIDKQDLPLYHFNDAPSNPPAPLREIRPETETVTRNTKNGTASIRILSDFGSYENTQHDLRHCAKLDECWSIDTTDVSNARGNIIWKRTMSRETFNVSTCVTAQVISDADNFTLTIQLEAFEGTGLVFSRHFDETFPRDLNTQT